MSAGLRLFIDGEAIVVPIGSSVAAAISHVRSHVRRSPSGSVRAPFCGMGVCFECQVRIDGQPGRRACLTAAVAGMRVELEP